MSTTELPEVKRITVTLTNHPPVRVDPREWPVIADARGHDGEVECQANEKWFLRVRQHDDGRTLVYGVREAGPGGQHAHYHGAAGGELLAPGVDIAMAIHRVGNHCGLEDYADECVADLPPVDL